MPIGVGVTLLAAFFGSILGLIVWLLHATRYADHACHGRTDGVSEHLAGNCDCGQPGRQHGECLYRADGGLHPEYRPLMRGSTLVIKNQLYVESARSVGLRDHSILWKYIFMNSLSPLIVQCTFVIAFAIISEAALSFLGAGVPPSTSIMGKHASGRTEVHSVGLVDGDISGDGAFHYGARSESARGWIAGRARSARTGTVGKRRT